MNRNQLMRAATRIALARGQPAHFVCLSREIVALAEEYAADDQISIPPAPRSAGDPGFGRDTKVLDLPLCTPIMRMAGFKPAKRSRPVVVMWPDNCAVISGVVYPARPGFSRDSDGDAISWPGPAGTIAQADKGDAK